ncbi:hypothetical protein HN51_028368, partial [Arachis hypogaea]
YGYDPFGLSKKPEDFAKLWHPTSLNFMQNVVNGNQSLYLVLEFELEIYFVFEY